MENQKIETISILGCGWLGLALGKELVELGYSVKGSTTRSERHDIIARFSIAPFQIKLIPELMGDDIPSFLQADVLIVSLPPRFPDDMEQFPVIQMQCLRNELLKTSLRKVIYLSSTSVYDMQDGMVDESGKLDEASRTGRALASAENVLRLTNSLGTTVLRLGGLAGYARIMGRYFAGKKEVENPYSPVNLVHRDDAVAIIIEIIKQQKWNTLFNVVAPGHPTRKDLYLADAVRVGFEAPEFSTMQGPYKLVGGEKVAKELQYTFKFPDPYSFYYGPDPLVIQKY